MDMEDKLRKAYKESVEYLESISALDLMKKSGLFMSDLKKLVDSQHLPVAILTGCLMCEIYRLNTEPDNMLLDNKIMGSFELFKRYTDKKFMEKE